LACLQVLVVIEFQGNHLGSAWPATRYVLISCVVKSP
jgi:hypothetical protein